MSHQPLAITATKLASILPMPTLQLVARLIEESASLAEARTKLAQELPHPQYRSLANLLIDQWNESAANLLPQTVSMMVLTAAHSEQAHRDAQSVELVWTGPESDAASFRRTEQAILQILDSATQRLTLVSYAVYKIPHICDALVRAARRGVRITVIVETPDRLAGEAEYSTLRALGPEVAACCSVFYWPKENRRQNELGKTGILHVKCVVADSRWLFLSSANLTEYAFTINMELGVLVTGGLLQRQIEDHFQQLVTLGVLQPV